MYLDADDARSDFFLAAAVYVIGPGLFALLADGLPGVFGTVAGQWILAILVPLLTTAAMPLFLMRYRGEPLTLLLGGGIAALGLGLLLSAPLLVGVGLGEALRGISPSALASAPAVTYVQIAVRWASLAALAVFLFRRAEYAFRAVSELQSTLVRQAGVAAAATVGVATVLLLLDDRPVVALLAAAGLAGVYPLAERLLPQQGMGERWWAWAPAITLALGPLRIFDLLLGGASFLASAQQAAGVAMVGLVVTMGLYARRGAALAFGLATGFALSNVMALLGGTSFFL